MEDIGSLLPISDLFVHYYMKIRIIDFFSFDLISPPSERDFLFILRRRSICEDIYIIYFSIITRSFFYKFSKKRNESRERIRDSFSFVI